MTEKNSKLFSRSVVLRELEFLKAQKDINPALAAKSIEKLSQIKDKELLASLVIDQMTGKGTTFNDVLKLILVACAGKCAEGIIFKNLSSKNVSDEKKLYLITILRELDLEINYVKLSEFIDPEALVDYETKKFLSSAKVNPQAQIDFLDFFFGINDKDKEMLMDSIISDFSHEELISILIPIIYNDPATKFAKHAMETLKKSKSYLVFEVYNWVINTSDDPSAVSLAKKCKNELKMLGLRKEVGQIELYKNILKDSAPLGFWASMLDGASNFVLLFARKNVLGNFRVFVTVLNPHIAPLACLGFDDLGQKEFETLFGRIFNENMPVKIDLSVGVKILNELTIKAQKQKLQVPYELLSWRQLTYDIEPVAGDLEDFFKSHFEKIRLNEFSFKKLLKQDFMQNWFIAHGDNPVFDKILEEIEKKSFAIEDIEKRIKENADDIFAGFEKTLLYQAYFAHCANNKDVADILYALSEISEKQPLDKKFQELIMKKSVYEHFSKETEPDNNTTVFKKEKKENVNAKRVLSIIKDKWQSEF